jgi:hypothetical protein
VEFAAAAVVGILNLLAVACLAVVVVFVELEGIERIVRRVVEWLRLVVDAVVADSSIAVAFVVVVVGCIGLRLPVVAADCDMTDCIQCLVVVENENWSASFVDQLVVVVVVDLLVESLWVGPFDSLVAFAEDIDSFEVVVVVDDVGLEWTVVVLVDVAVVVVVGVGVGVVVVIVVVVVVERL